MRQDFDLSRFTLGADEQEACNTGAVRTLTDGLRHTCRLACAPGDCHGDGHPSCSTQGVAPLALGKTATTAMCGTVTVYAHKKNVEPQDANQEAVDVKVCTGPKPAGANSDDYPTIGNTPWTLHDGADRRYEAATTRWSLEGAQPGYPVEQRVNWGDCIRGWVIIQGQATAKMTKVRYTTESTILEWKLP